MRQPGDHLILVIEDEPPIRRFLRASLANEGFRVVEASTGADGVRQAASQPPDLVILDLGLPDIDGREVLQRLREWLPVPIIVLTARDEERQKIELLDGGADDYVTKPFGMGELLARVRTSLRHFNSPDTTTSVFQFGDLKIDLASRLVYRKGLQVHLTPLEYRLFATMVKHSGKVLTHRFLLREVWGPENSQETHYLRVFVASLRKKLEDDPAMPKHILNEPAVGYRLANDL